MPQKEKIYSLREAAREMGMSVSGLRYQIKKGWVQTTRREVVGVGQEELTRLRLGLNGGFQRKMRT